MAAFLRMLWSGRERPVRPSLQHRCAPYTVKPLTDAEVKERLFGRRAYWRSGKRA